MTKKQRKKYKAKCQKFSLSFYPRTITFDTFNTITVKDIVQLKIGDNTIDIDVSSKDRSEKAIRRALSDYYNLVKV